MKILKYDANYHKLFLKTVQIIYIFLFFNIFLMKLNRHAFNIYLAKEHQRYTDELCIPKNGIRNNIRYKKKQ